MANNYNVVYAKHKIVHVSLHMHVRKRKIFLRLCYYTSTFEPKFI